MELKKVCLAGFAIVLTTSASWAFTYTIDSNPQGAVVINVITKERMGLTPIKVDIPDTQEGKKHLVSFTKTTEMLPS
uniref:Uncharacterized protein n=1 Tax=Klebsiella pneumoniae TaxID=573 RepID=A0A8B0STI0_KLEPN|nr:hypothetical protein [Klebsiella pneumoniae]